MVTVNIAPTEGLVNSWSVSAEAVRRREERREKRERERERERGGRGFEFVRCRRTLPCTLGPAWKWSLRLDPSKMCLLIAENSQRMLDRLLGEPAFYQVARRNGLLISCEWPLLAERVRIQIAYGGRSIAATALAAGEFTIQIFQRPTCSSS